MGILLMCSKILENKQGENTLFQEIKINTIQKYLCDLYNIITYKICL